MEDRSFEGIAHLALFCDANGCHEPVLGLHHGVARVHEHEAPGPIGVLSLSRLEATVPEK